MLCAPSCGVLNHLLFSIPFPLLAAELSCLIDINGGYIEWVNRAMGPFCAWLTAFNRLGSNLCDIPLYSILFASYLRPQLAAWIGEPSWVAMYGLKLFCLVFITILNVRGIEDVGHASFVLSVLILAPFAIQLFMSVQHLEPSAWGIVASPIKWSSFVSILLWNLQGFDSLGAVAGEVKNARRNYPLGILLALVFIVFVYVIPVAVGVSIDRDISKWVEGHISVVAGKTAGWLGVWVVLAATMAQLGNGLAMMASASRCVWQMSQMRMLPRVLGKMWDRYNSPAAGVSFHTVITLGLMLMSFDVLVVIDTLFNNMALLFEAFSFLILRYREPVASRAEGLYTVPGGLPLAWVLTTSKTLVILFGIGTAGSLAWIVCGVSNVIFIALYTVVWAIRRRESHRKPNEQTLLAQFFTSPVSFDAPLKDFPKDSDVEVEDSDRYCLSDDEDESDMASHRPAHEVEGTPLMRAVTVREGDDDDLELPQLVISRRHRGSSAADTRPAKQFPKPT